MDYREISRNLDFSKHLRVIKPEAVKEWKEIINRLILEPFVKQLEIHSDATSFYDTFIFVSGNHHFVIRHDDVGTKIFYSNDTPYHFGPLLEDYPDCDLPNPTAVSVSHRSPYMVISALAYFQLVQCLVKKRFISENKAFHLLKLLKDYQTSILNEVDIALQDTEYFRHVWWFYQNALKLVDRKYTFPEKGIKLERFLDTPAIILSCNTYQEVYYLNKHNQMLVLPVDKGGNSVCYKTPNNFHIETFLAMTEDIFIESTYPMGYFVSLIDFNGPPYTLMGINPNLFQAHQVMLFNTFTMMANTNK